MKRLTDANARRRSSVDLATNAPSNARRLATNQIDTRPFYYERKRQCVSNIDSRRENKFKPPVTNFTINLSMIHLQK